MRRAQAQIVYETSLVAAEGGEVTSSDSYTSAYLADEEAPVESWQYRYAKRAFDILCSLPLIILFTIPGLLIALAIRLTSEGPVFYREERIGRDGRPFQIWKFRSMHKSAAKSPFIAGEGHDKGKLEWRMRKGLGDPRITAVGALLRRWSLDEVPQLYNVLRGEMSLIGPRPIVMAEAVLYGDLLGFYLAATPGLSGLWQVSGRSNIDYERRARMDALYVQSWSFAGDLNILFRTLPAVLSRIGAH